MGERGIGLDLNEEPVVLSGDGMDADLGLTLYTDPEVSRRVIIDRMRQLEAVTFRARERQRSRESAGCSANSETREGSISVQENKVGIKRIERESSHLVAKALGIDPRLRNKGSGAFYDCNICLEMARDPILTCCGHLFCWPCFYKLSYIQTNVKECPVCRGEVKDSSIIPIYGNGHAGDSHKTEMTVDGKEVPPRPHAQRIESERQQLYGREESPFERLQRQFNNIMRAMEIQGQNPIFPGVGDTAPRALVLGNQYHYSYQLPRSAATTASQPPYRIVSRMLGQGSEPYLSLPSALDDSLDSLGRFIESNLAYIDGEEHLRDPQEIDEEYSFAEIAASVLPGIRARNPSAGIHFRPPLPSDRRNTVGSSSNQTMDARIDNSPTEPSSSSSRGTITASRVSTGDGRIYLRPRHRR